MNDIIFKFCLNCKAVLNQTGWHKDKKFCDHKCIEKYGRFILRLKNLEKKITLLEQKSKLTKKESRKLSAYQVFVKYAKRKLEEGLPTIILNEQLSLTKSGIPWSPVENLVIAK